MSTRERFFFIGSVDVRDVEGGARGFEGRTARDLGGGFRHIVDAGHVLEGERGAVDQLARPLIEAHRLVLHAGRVLLQGRGATRRDVATLGRIARARDAAVLVAGALPAAASSPQLFYAGRAT